MQPKLFTPLALGSFTLPNRIVIPPMCQYAANEGVAQNWHTVHYGTLAASGAGMLVVEATAVCPEGRISPRCLILQTDEQEAALAQLVRNIKDIAPIVPVLQLGHAGRKASCDVPWETGSCLSQEAGGWQTVAPSAEPMNTQDTQPLPLTLEEIDTVKKQFAASALRAKRAGFAGIELHAAHGYLLHQFLSPLSNTRTDQYGGTLENRMRLVLEVFSTMQAAVGKQFLLGVRLSASDWVEGGWDVEQTAQLCQRLEALGCAFFDISSGGLSSLQKIPLSAGYQVPFAQRIKQAVNAPVIAVGLITEPTHAEEILATGKADAIGIARGMLWNPRWPWHAAAALGGKVAMPPRYWRGVPHGVAKVFE